MNRTNQRLLAARRGRRVGELGFTLIELLLVLVILAVLAAIVVPKFTGRSEQARQAAASAGISSIRSALRTFEVDCGRFPTNDEGLAALLDPPAGLKGWHGPYVEGGKVPLDPWNNPFVYRYPGQQNKSEYDLFSMGPDGHEGGGDDIFQ